MTEPNWQNRRTASPTLRKEREAEKPRDYVAEAKAAIGYNDQKPELVAAVIVAQALDRFGKNLETAAAVSNYKRV